MVVDVLQRAVLGKAREIHYLRWCHRAPRLEQQIATAENPI